MVLPCTSVIVIMVLLNVALTWATPEAMFLRSRRGTRVASLPILNPYPGSEPDLPAPLELRSLPCERAARLGRRNALFLLAGNCLGRTLAGAGVGMGTLATDWQAAAMPQPPIAT